MIDPGSWSDGNLLVTITFSISSFVKWLIWLSRILLRLFPQIKITMTWINPKNIIFWWLILTVALKLKYDSSIIVSSGQKGKCPVKHLSSPALSYDALNYLYWLSVFLCHGVKHSELKTCCICGYFNSIKCLWCPSQPCLMSQVGVIQCAGQWPAPDCDTWVSSARDADTGHWTEAEAEADQTPRPVSNNCPQEMSASEARTKLRDIARILLLSTSIFLTPFHTFHKSIKYKTHPAGISPVIRKTILRKPTFFCELNL